MSATLELDADTAAPGSEFLAFNPQLPLLAAKAAIELEQRRLGSPVSVSSFQELARLLFEPGSSGGIAFAPDRCFVDPLGAHVLARAYLDSHNNNIPLNSKNELLTAAEKLQQEFKQLGGAERVEERTLIALRDFCRALSEYSSMSRKLVVGERPPHPQRKVAAL